MPVVRWRQLGWCCRFTATLPMHRRRPAVHGRLPDPPRTHQGQQASTHPAADPGTADRPGRGRRAWQPPDPAVPRRSSDQARRRSAAADQRRAVRGRQHRRERALATPDLLHRRAIQRGATAGHAVRHAPRRRPYHHPLRHGPRQARPPRRPQRRGLPHRHGRGSAGLLSGPPCRSREDGVEGCAWDHHRRKGDVVIRLVEPSAGPARG